ncbi:hypothetical protein KW798_02275 [Candidatus Parcubacteria bacterium]|nr:hypothetical protein [Candidatus Parcubacteria bacterium]
MRFKDLKYPAVAVMLTCIGIWYGTDKPPVSTAQAVSTPTLPVSVLTIQDIKKIVREEAHKIVQEETREIVASVFDARYGKAIADIMAMDRRRIDDELAGKTFVLSTQPPRVENPEVKFLPPNHKQQPKQREARAKQKPEPKENTRRTTWGSFSGF